MPLAISQPQHLPNLHLASSNLSLMVVDLGELDASLQEALEPPYVGNKHAIVQALLEVRPRLLKLFDVGMRKADEKKEVESGLTYLCPYRMTIADNVYILKARSNSPAANRLL